MCRNITTLRGLDPEATAEEIDAAVRQVAAATTALLATLPPRQQPPPTLPPLRRLRTSAAPA